MEQDSSDLSNLSGPVKKDASAEPKYNFSYNMPNKKSNKTTLVLACILLMILLALGFFFRSKITGLFGSNATVPTPSPSAYETSSPSPSSLVRSDWTFEVLNGSGVSGVAKKVAEELQKLGYLVLKTGNADKQTYAKTEILVRKDYADGGAFGTKINLVIADIKDVIKIASVAGELREGTASARIIIGKDSI